jgi:hypothetical protein
MGKATRMASPGRESGGWYRALGNATRWMIIERVGDRPYETWQVGKPTPQRGRLPGLLMTGLPDEGRLPRLLMTGLPHGCSLAILEEMTRGPVRRAFPRAERGSEVQSRIVRTH